MLITKYSFSCFYFSLISALGGELCNAEALLKEKLFEGLPKKMHSMEIYNVRALIFVYIFGIYIKQRQKDPLNQIYHIYSDIFKNDKKASKQTKKKESPLLC